MNSSIEVKLHTLGCERLLVHKVEFEVSLKREAKHELRAVPFFVQDHFKGRWMKNETKNDELATAERTVKIDYIKIVIHTEVFDRKRNNKTRRRPVGLGQSIKLI